MSDHLKNRFILDQLWVRDGVLNARFKDNKNDKYTTLTGDAPIEPPPWTVERIEARIAEIVEHAKEDPERASSEELELIDNVMKYIVERPKLRNGAPSAEVLIAAVMKVRALDFRRY